MKKIFPLTTITVLLTLIPSLVHAFAQCHTVETDRFFQWAEVPAALDNPEPGNPNIPLEPWYLDLNSLMYRGEILVFEAASPDAQYVLFHGHCQSNYIRAVYEGEFLDTHSIRYYLSSDDWQPAVGSREALLSYACAAF